MPQHMMQHCRRQYYTQLLMKKNPILLLQHWTQHFKEVYRTRYFDYVALYTSMTIPVDDINDLF